jgi:hypothetical protein
MTDTKNVSERDAVALEAARRIDALFDDALNIKNAEIARLNREVAGLRVIADGAADDIERLNAEIEQMTEGRKLHDELADHLEHEIERKNLGQSALCAALVFYADGTNYNTRGWQGDPDPLVMQDRGERARHALEVPSDEIEQKEQS